LDIICEKSPKKVRRKYLNNANKDVEKGANTKDNYDNSV
jgi:hypothetical protein